MKWEELKKNESGLVPCIVQDVLTKKVLMLAYFSEESLQRTLSTKQMWYWSRSREELWHKGATSGNVQHLVKLTYDCDKDTLLALVTPQGPACHRGTETCFKEDETVTGDLWFLVELENIIRDRQHQLEDESYTAYLFKHGIDKIAKKFGEEAFEVVIAAKNREKNEVVWESADLIYHLLVLLREQDVELRDVVEKLHSRHRD